MELEARTEVGVAPRTRILSALLALPVLFGIVAMAASLALRPFAIAGFVGLLGLLAAQQLAGRRKPSRLAATAAGLVVDGRLYPRATLRDGYVRPADAKSPPRVVMDGDRTIVVEVADEAVGKDLLAALALDLAHQPRTFALARPRTTDRRMSVDLAIVAVVTFAVMLLAMWPVLLVPFFYVAMALGPLLASAAGSLRIGADGVLVKDFFSARFVPKDRITGIEKDGEGTLVLHTADGPIVLDEGGKRRFGPSPDVALDTHEAIIARVNELIAMKATGGDTSLVSLEEALARPAEVPVREWLAGLAVRVGTDYRSAIAAGEDELARVVETSGSRWARLGAAVVLARRKAEAPRIRIAAEASVEPKVRVALETIASGASEDAIEQALAEVGEEAVVVGRPPRRAS